VFFFGRLGFLLIISSFLTCLDDVWIAILVLLSERDVYHVIFAFPELYRLKLSWQQGVQKLIWSEQEVSTKFIPKVVSQSGILHEIILSSFLSF
jgi:hypothetical protein